MIHDSRPLVGNFDALFSTIPSIFIIKNSFRQVLDLKKAKNTKAFKEWSFRIQSFKASENRNGQ